MRAFLIVLLLFCACICSNAQQILNPGDRLINVNAIKPSQSLYKMIFTDSLGNKRTEVTNEVNISVDKQRNLVTVTQFQYFTPGRVKTDSSIADLITLEPVRMTMNTSPAFMSMGLLFNKARVITKATRGKLKIDTVYQMPEGYFDSSIFEFLLSLIKIGPGFHRTLNTFTMESKGNDLQHVKYIGEDVLEKPDGNFVPVLVVEVKSAKSTSLCWLEKATGVMIKRVINLGKQGRFIVIKI